MARRCETPCPTCPWRVGQDAATIPHYDQDQAVELLNTVGEGDTFRPIMACHGSTDAKPRICKGYLAQAGWTNIAVRLMIAQGRCPTPEHVLDACKAKGIALEPDYPTVLAKLSES